jgi:hypothetical protein
VNETTAIDTTTPPTITRRDIKRELPCKLTNEELLEVATAKAEAELQLEELEAEFANVRGDWKGKLEDQAKAIGKLGAELRSKSRIRVVICHEQVPADSLDVEVVRDDTSEVLERRAATLFEVRKVRPDSTTLPENFTGDDSAADAALAAAAAETMAAAGVEEDEDGDVVAPAGDGKRKGKKGKRA